MIYTKLKHWIEYPTMKIEIVGTNNFAWLYEMDNKHYVIGNYTIYQLDNSITKSLYDVLGHESDRQLVVCVPEENFTVDNTRYDAIEHQATTNLYFVPSKKLIVATNKRKFVIFALDLTVIITGDKFEAMFTIGDDVYINNSYGEPGLCYKNFKPYESPIKYNGAYYRGTFGENTYSSIYTDRREHASFVVPTIKVLKHMEYFTGYVINTGPKGNIYDFVNKKYVNEIVLGTIKNHQFIRKPDGFIIREVNQEASNLDQKSKNLKLRKRD